MNFLLMHVYGKEIYKRQTLFSILSFVARKQAGDGQFHIVIYTDKPRHIKMFFKDYVKVEKLEPQTFEAQGQGPDAARKVKMHVIRDFLNHHYGNMLYADIDTYFNVSAEPLFKAMNEGNVVLNDAANTTFDGVAPSNALYDTGIIGIQTNQHKIMDEVMSAYNAQPNTKTPEEKELQAFTDVFSKTSLTSSPRGTLLHYKHDRDLVQSRIDAFFDKHFYRELGELMQLVGKWTPERWDSGEESIELI